MDWQPIETAPRDGTVIHLWGAHYPDVVVGWWTGNRHYPWAFIDDTKQALTGCCEDEETGRIMPNAFSAGYEPTHWMPLPPPPGDQQG